jgi:hypothetical protein
MHLGNVTDLTTEDPGYTNMVGDPTYTLTFPSVFPSGETPDVELPPGTKYQVEVKATNDVGVDNAFSNDVMPVAGLLQTSVITASEAIPGRDYSAPANQSGAATVPGYDWDNAFDGVLTGYGAQSSVVPYDLAGASTLTFSPPITGTDIQVLMGGTNSGDILQDHVAFGFNGAAATTSNTTEVSYDSVNNNTYMRLVQSIGGPGITTLTSLIAGNENMRGVQVDGVLLVDNTSQTQLTTTDNTNYNLFSAGDAVVESSGGTPVTSAITNVNTTATTTGPFAGARTYDGYAGATYNNATPYVISSGDTFNGTSSNVFLFDRGQLGSTYSLTFTKTGGAENFQTYTSDSPSTTFSELDNNAAGPLVFDQSNTLYKQYVLIYATGSGSITWELTGTASVGTLLTLTNDTNLANFRVGDLVQGSGTGKYTVWTSSAANSTTPLTSLSQSDYTQNGPFASGVSATWGGNKTAIVYDAGAVVDWEVYFGNIGIAEPVDYFFESDDFVTWTSLPVPSSPDFKCASSKRYIAWQSSYANWLGATQSGIGYLPIPAVITAINETTPSITTDGGIWSGTDGTGSPGTWNQSQVWSNYFTTPPSIAGTQTRAFDGTLGMQGGYWTGECKWEPTTPITYYDKVEVYDGLGQRYHTNDESGYSDATPNTWMLLRANTNGASGDVLTSIEIERPGDDNEVHTMSGLRIDGRLYVDTGVSGAPTTEETFVTGPTFPPATGTILSTGTRITDAAIQTSTITNVAEVAPTITNTVQIASAISSIKVQTGGSTVYSGAKTPAGVLGLNSYPDLWTPVNPNPNKNGSNEAAAIEMVAGEPLSITCIGSAPFKLLTVSNLAGGGAYSYTITGDVTVTGTTGGSQGRYKALSDEVTITPNTSGATFTFTANNGMYINYVPLGGDTVLTLTDTTDLAFFTPGDIVQPADGITVYANAPRTDTVPNTKTGIKYRMSITDLPSGSSQYTISQLFGGFPSELTITGNVETWASATLTSGPTCLHQASPLLVDLGLAVMVHHQVLLMREKLK